MIARWHEALDAQAEGFAFYDSEMGRAYAEGWARSWGPGGTHVSSATGEPMSELAVTGYLGMVRSIAPALLQADTLYVEPDMMRLVEGVVAGFEPEPLHAEDLPTPAGFLCLPYPLTIYDRHQVPTSVRAFLWYPTTFGDWERMADRLNDTPATVVPARNGRTGALGVTLVMFHAVGDKDAYDGEERKHGAFLRPGTLLINHIFPWVYGLSYPHLPTSGGLLDIARPLKALFRLMQQTVAVSYRERPARGVRRRVPPPLAEHLITVVRLRRPRSSSEDEGDASHVDWTHRWLVSGHWRWQPYPSLGPGVRKQIWISPYIKGPEDRPLVIRKARVFDLAR